MVFDRFSRRTAGGIALTLIAIVLSVVSAPDLPAEVVSHWNAAGEPDGTMAKSMLLYGGPAIVAGIVLMFEVIPRIDPLASNIEQFQRTYDVIALTTAAFLVYAFGVVTVRNLGYQLDILMALAPAIAVLYVVIGFVLDNAKRNWFVGIRTPWTLSSDAVWERTHSVGGQLFKIAGVLALGAVVLPDYSVYFFAAPAAAIALVLTVYSFVLYRRLGNGDPADAV